MSDDDRNKYKLVVEGVGGFRGLGTGIAVFFIAFGLVGGVKRVDCYMGVEVACDAINDGYAKSAEASQ